MLSDFEFNPHLLRSFIYLLEIVTFLNEDNYEVKRLGIFYPEAFPFFHSTENSLEGENIQTADASGSLKSVKTFNCPKAEL